MIRDDAYWAEVEELVAQAPPLAESQLEQLTVLLRSDGPAAAAGQQEGRRDTAA